MVTLAHKVTAEEVNAGATGAHKTLKNYLLLFLGQSGEDNYTYIGNGIFSEAERLSNNQKGTLTVSNTITDGGDGDSCDYKITIADKDYEGTGTGSTSVTLKTEGKTKTGTFTLKTGESVNFTGITDATNFTVEQTGTNGKSYTTMNAVSTSKPSSGTAESSKASGVITGTSGSTTTTYAAFFNTISGTPVPTPTGVTYHLNLPSELGKTGDYVYQDETENTILELWEIDKFSYGSDEIDGVDIKTNTEGSGEEYTTYSNGYLKKGKSDRYYFAGWSKLDAAFEPSTNDYSHIDYPVVYMSGHTSGKGGGRDGYGVRAIYGYQTNFVYTPEINEPQTARFSNTGVTELYAIWVNTEDNAGLFGYTMQIAGATFPDVDLSASSDSWHITDSDTRLGSNGTGGDGTWQKFTVLDGGHKKGEAPSKAMTVEAPQPTATDSDGTWNFTGWFNKFANKDGDPNKDYILIPGGAGGAAETVEYGGNNDVYSLDAIWSQVKKPDDQVEVYKDDGSSPDFGALSVVLKGGSYSNNGRTDRTGWNTIFSNNPKDTTQTKNVTSEKLRFDVDVTGPESQTLTDKTLSELSSLKLTKPGVYTIKVNPKLEDVDASAGHDGTTGVTIDLGTIEFTYTIIPQLTVNVTKDLQGRDWRSGDSFEFTVTANGTAATDSPITVNEASGHKGSAVVSFKEITEPSGTEPYNITVTETTTGETGMDYAAPKTIEVTLTKDSDGAYKLGGGGVKLDESTGNYTLDVTMLNKLNTGSLTITKKLDGTASGDHTDDTFTFTVSTADRTFTGTYGDTTFTSGTATVTITGAGSKTINGLPAGMTFTVEETDSKDASATTYKVDGETATGKAEVTIAQDKESKVEVTNLYANPGNLTISKTVEGNNLTTGEHTFTFTISFTDKSGAAYTLTSTPDGVTPEGSAGKYKFDIKADRGTISPDSVKFENLPYGTQFTINEVKEEHMDHPVAGVNYATVGTPKGTFNVATHSGIIGDGDNMEIKVTNVSPFGKVTIENKVIGVPANKDQTYTYTMTLSGGDHALHYSGAVGNTSFNNGTATFTLKKGEKIDVYLPVNINYTITQSTDKASCGDDWTKLAVTTQKTDSLPASTVSTKGDNGAEGHTVSTSTSSSAGEDSAHTVTFTNYYLADLTIKKNVVGGTATEFGFEVTLTGDELTAPGIGLTHGTTGTENTGYSSEVTFTLNDGGEYTFKNIPTGTKYSVEETNKKDADKTTYTINSGESTETTPTGVVLTANTTVTVTNEYTKTSGGTGGGGGGTGGTGKPSVSIDDHEHYAYIIGMPSGLVEPEDNITRAEIATIIFRLLKEDVRAANWTKANPFPDVNIDNWYNNAVSTLYKMGIVEGRNDGLFHPDDPITRAEMAAMMARLYDYDDSTGEFSSKFADVDPHAWYARYVDAAEKLGLFYGYTGDPNFYPNKNLTRAEAMTVYNRLLGRRPHKNHLLPTDQMIMWPDNMDTSAWYYADIQEATNSHTCNIAGATEGGETFEQWLSRLPVRDWSALERAWSEAYSGSDGHDVN